MYTAVPTLKQILGIDSKCPPPPPTLDVSEPKVLAGMTTERAQADGYKLVNSRGTLKYWAHSAGSMLVEVGNGRFKKVLSLEKEGNINVYLCEPLCVNVSDKYRYLDTEGLLIGFECYKCKTYFDEGDHGVSVLLRNQQTYVDSNSLKPIPRSKKGGVVLWDKTQNAVVCMHCFELGVKLNTMKLTEAKHVLTAVL